MLFLEALDNNCTYVWGPGSDMYMYMHMYIYTCIDVPGNPFVPDFLAIPVLGCKNSPWADIGVVERPQIKKRREKQKTQRKTKNAETNQKTQRQTKKRREKQQNAESACKEKVGHPCCWH